MFGKIIRNDKLKKKLYIENFIEIGRKKSSKDAKKL